MSNVPGVARLVVMALAALIASTTIAAALSQTPLWNNGTPITGTINCGITVDGFALALQETGATVVDGSLTSRATGATARLSNGEATATARASEWRNERSGEIL